jgi:TonB family protein
MRGDDAEFTRLQQDADVLRERLQQVAKAEKARAATPRSVVGLDISKLDRTPTPRYQQRPQYPQAMRQAGISGEVVVDFVVDANGEVKNAQAVRSSRVEFEAAAVEAVSAWKFNPGQKGGNAVNTHLQVPIVFTLPSDGAANEASRQTLRLSAEPPKTSGDPASVKEGVVKLESFTVAGQRADAGKSK